MRLASQCIALSALTVSVAACDPGETTRYEYDPYVGEAFPDRSQPVDLPAGGVALTTDSYSDTISLVALADKKLFASFPVGRDPVTIDGPHHLAIDEKAGRLYTALSYPQIGTGGPHASHGSSARPGYVQMLSLLDFRVLGEVRVDENPGDIVVSSDGARLLVSHFDLNKAIENAGNLEAQRATLAIIDPSTLSEEAPPSPPRIPVCIAPHAIALSHDGSRAWVACYGEDSIALVDLAAPEVTDRIPVAPGADAQGNPNHGPYAAVLSPDGARLAVGNQVSRDVTFIDVATLAIIPEATLPTLGVPFFPAWSADSTTLYVVTQTPNAVIAVDTTADNAELARRDFAAGECDLPHVASVVGAAVLVVCEGDHEVPGAVLTLDATTLEIESTTEVGIYPDALVRVGGGR